MLTVLLLPALASAQSTGPVSLIAQLEGNQAGDGFGSSVAVGDFDDDGFDDAAVTSNRGLLDKTAVVLVFRGSSAGLVPVPTILPLPDDLYVGRLAVGDLDGDGVDDLVMYVREAGALHLHRGSPAGLSATPDATVDILEGEGATTLFATDTNSDGLDELFVTTGYSGSWRLEGHPALAGLLTELPDVGDDRGAGPVDLGDADGDGFGDVLLPVLSDSSFYNTDWWASFGSPQGSVAPAHALWSGYPGEEVASVGDVNADGFSDLAVEFTYSYFPQPDVPDQIVIFAGGPHTRDAPVDSWGTSPLFGHELAVLDDFGCGFAPVGDYNGDGIDDALLLACGPGGLHTFLGDPAGLRQPAVSTLDLSLLVVPTWWMAETAAGDVDGDGRDELLISDVYYANSKGRVLVYTLADLGANAPTGTTPTDPGTPTDSTTPTGTSSPGPAAEPAADQPTDPGGCGCGSAPVHPLVGVGLWSRRR